METLFLVIRNKGMFLIWVGEVGVEFLSWMDP